MAKKKSTLGVTVRIIHSSSPDGSEVIYITEDLDTDVDDFIVPGDSLVSDEEIEWSHIPPGFPMENQFNKA